MKIDFNEIRPKIIITEDKKRSDLLAYVSLSLIEEHGRWLSINGFTIRTSKHNGKPYLTLPSKSTAPGRFYKFVMSEKSLMKEIEKEVLKEYEKETIPVVEDKIL